MNQSAPQRASESQPGPGVGDAVTESAAGTTQLPLGREIRYRAAWVVSVLAVGALYFWVIGIGAVSDRFVWNSDLDQVYDLKGSAIVQGSIAVDGYYDLLGRAFANGHLNLPVNPSPQLLALPDPWSDLTNRYFRLLDTALYDRHYYLYHGATPALLLFAPWYLVTRHDLPENFAAFLLALGAFLFLSELFTEVLSSLSMRLPLSLYALFLVALGVGQSVPFILHRAKVYEIAILGGYFCLSAAFYFLFRRLADSGHPLLWAGLSGAFFGLAIGCRPHLGLAAVSAFALLILLPDPLTKVIQRMAREDVRAFALPLMVCGLGICAYNFARFDNPLEFGTRYLLGEDSYRNFHLALANLWPGLYYLMICPPELVPEFPFFRLTLLQPFSSLTNVLPAGYFLELTGGFLTLAPLTVLAPVPLIWWKLWNEQRVVTAFLAAMFISAAGCLFFVALIPVSSQRFEVDFLPFLFFVACVAAVQLLRAFNRNVVRMVATAAVAGLLLYCIASNIALAIQGPYDQFVQASPRNYVHLARWFSPLQRYRPLLNPSLRVQAVFDFREPCLPRREPLLSAGEFGSRYLLSAECAGVGRIRLVSESSVRHPDYRLVELPVPSPGQYTAGLEFTPDNRTMTITWNGKTVLQHPLRFLVTARSQIHFGWDPSLGNPNRFDGRILASPPLLLDVNGGK